MCGFLPVLKSALTPVTLLQRPPAHLLEDDPHFAQSVPVPRRHVHARPEELLRGDQIPRIFRADGFFQHAPYAHVHLVLDGRLGGTVECVVQTRVRNEVTASEFIEIGAGVDAGINVVQDFHRRTHATRGRTNTWFS